MLFLVGADPLNGFITVHDRHVDVHNDCIWHTGSYYADVFRLVAVTRAEISVSVLESVKSKLAVLREDMRVLVLFSEGREKLEIDVVVIDK